jgi:hypothetical protein
MQKCFPMLALACLPLCRKRSKSARSGRQLFTRNDEAAKYLFHVWQTEQFAVYGTCMAKHGQRFD